MTPVPFTVIGGFLGAGKTTLLNRLLGAPGGLRFAVLVNDFGRIAIDEALVREHAGDTIALANGCVCCSLAGGFVRALVALAGRVEQFDHVVVEASGVADPARTLDVARIDATLSPNGIVVLVDAATVREHCADRYVGDTVRRQLAVADLLVVNKTDLVGESERVDLLAWLRDLAPAAAVVQATYAQVALELVLGAHPRSLRHAGEASGSETPHGDSWRSFSYQSHMPIARAAFEAAVASLPATVLRGKGFVCFAGAAPEVMQWQKVGARSTVSACPGAKAGTRSRVVLIATAELDQAALAPFARVFAKP